MTGEEEARAFEQRNYVGLHQSTLRKVDVIANILSRVQDRTLHTNTNWREMHGGSIRGIWNWIAENKTIALIASIASIIGLVIAILTFGK